MAAPSGSPSGPQMPPMEQIGSAYGGRGPVTMAISWIGLIVTTTLVMGRVYLRVKKSGNMEKAHDVAMWLALFSWFLGVIATALLTVSAAHGLGNHTSLLSLPNIITASKYQWISVSLAAFSAGTSKASVVAFLLALQARSSLHKGWIWLLYFLAITNVVINFAIMFIIIYQCNPAEATWDITIQDAHCYSRDHLFGPVGLVQACWTAVSDFILAIYPVFIVFRLQISTRLKIFLCCLMGLGVIASAFSFVKMAELVHIVKSPPKDPLYDIAMICIWGQIELWMVLIALSVPPIWPLLKPAFSGFTSYISSTWNSRSNSSEKSGGSTNNWKWTRASSNASAPQDMSSHSSKRTSNGSGESMFNPNAIKARTDVTVTSEEAGLPPHCQTYQFSMERNMI